MKYRPKLYILYMYTTLPGHQVNVSCYPQSKWELVASNNKLVTLRNKNVKIDIDREDFERDWKEVS